MPKLSFSLGGFRSSELQSLDLPVEIRKPSLALVSRTLSSKNIDVAPGTYLVSTTLPAGQQLFREVEVKAGDVQASLSPELEDESPHEFHEQHHFFGEPYRIAPDVAGITVAVPPKLFHTRDVTVSLVTGGDPIAVSRIPFLMPGNVQKLGNSVQFNYRDYSNPGFGLQHYLEILQPNQSATRVALPANGDKYCVLVIKATSPTTNSVDVHLQNTEADLLLRGLNKGSDISIVTESTNLSPDTLLQVNAEEIVRQKMADPIAACVGAYALLQRGEIERLHDWTENLKNWFPWLPDGLAIRGEHLAQAGKHVEALECFAALPSRGTPLFRDGLSYAVERLRLYTRAKSTPFTDAALTMAHQTFNRLEGVASHVDLSQSILTVKGLTPSPEIQANSSITLTIDSAPDAPESEIRTDAATGGAAASG